mgnify:CR=1 FL=1
MNMYRDSISKGGENFWVKVDVRPSRPEDLMAFTVRSKKAGEGESRWNTAGKVPVIFPQTWGRLNKDQKEAYMLQSFKKF